MQDIKKDKTTQSSKDTPVEHSTEKPKTRGPLLITPEQMSLYMSGSTPAFFQGKTEGDAELDAFDSDLEDEKQLTCQ